MYILYKINSNVIKILHENRTIGIWNVHYEPLDVVVNIACGSQTIEVSDTATIVNSGLKFWNAFKLNKQYLGLQACM